MNILFVCSRNKWRSRTAETIFKNNGTHQVKSAGTEKSAKIRINQSLINWADIIFVMEQKHKNRINSRFKISTSIQILEIPDDYQYMDENLIDILKADLKEYF